MATRTPQDNELDRIQIMLRQGFDSLEKAINQAKSNKWKGATGEKILEKKLKLAKEFVNNYYKP